MFFIPLLFGGVAATYMHKKFPKTTEAVAAGVTTATVWTLKKVGDAAMKAVNGTTPEKPADATVNIVDVTPLEKPIDVSVLES